MSFGPSHMASILPKISTRVAKKSGINAKISLQRIYAAWVDIIGQDFAHKSIPVNITWKKEKPRKSAFKKADKTDKAGKPEAEIVATLHILCASAVSTQIMYQEALIIERLSRNLGYSAVKHIAVKHENGLDIRLKTVLFPAHLSTADKGFLDDALGDVEDQSLKKLLHKLGEKILLDKRS